MKRIGSLLGTLLAVLVTVFSVMLIFDSLKNGSLSELGFSGDSYSAENIPELSPEKKLTLAEKYMYSHLDDKSKALYERMYAAIGGHAEKISGDMSDFTVESVHKIYKAVLRDNPELFYIDTGGTVKYFDSEGAEQVKEFVFTYTVTDEQTQSYMQQLEAAAEDFIASVPSSASDFEKAEAVYDYLINNTVYDSELYGGLTDTVTAEVAFSPGATVIGALLEGTAVCSGYAKATQYLLNKLGVECVYVSGYAGGVSHAWNLAKLSGEYYYIDTTWGDPVSEGAGNNNITHAYLAITTQQLLRTHTPDDEVPLPECTATDCNYFIMHSSLLSEYSFGYVSALVANAVEKRAGYCEIAFENKESFDEACEILFDYSGVFDVLESAAGYNSKLITDNLTHTLDSDNYIIKLIFKYDE